MGYDQWRKRDLSQRRYVYIWADGIYCNVRMDDRLCLLVVIGSDDTGRKEVLAVVDGYRESEASWTEVIEQLESQGLQIVRLEMHKMPTSLLCLSPNIATHPGICPQNVSHNFHAPCRPGLWFLAVLCTQQRCCFVLGQRLATAFQNPKASSPMASSGELAAHQDEQPDGISLRSSEIENHEDEELWEPENDTGDGLEIDGGGSE